MMSRQRLSASGAPALLRPSRRYDVPCTLRSASGSMRSRTARGGVSRSEKGKSRGAPGAAARSSARPATRRAFRHLPRTMPKMSRLVTGSSRCAVECLRPGAADAAASPNSSRAVTARGAADAMRDGAPGGAGAL